MKALLQIYTGDGKGKTTAGVGLCIRAVGAGLKVLYTQFLKDGSSSEIEIMSKINGIDLFLATKSFGFIKYMSESELKEAKEYYNDYLLSIIKKVKENNYDILVIDEFMAAYNYAMIDKETAFNFIQNNKGKLELVLTGRDVPKEIEEICDYLSEIKKVKHPFDEGIAARLGIEY